MNSLDQGREHLVVRTQNSISILTMPTAVPAQVICKCTCTEDPYSSPLSWEIFFADRRAFLCRI